MSQIVGLFGKAITAATIIAPLIGIILGSYRGVISTLFGGIISLSFNPAFSYPSFFAGVATALCAGLLCTNRRIPCSVVYSLLLLLFGFFPSVGPVWLYLPMIWFQILGLLILISPLQSFASKNFESDDNSRLFYAFFVTSLSSTLAGQIAGSLVFETMVDASFLKAYWVSLTFLYPLERIAIAIIVALVGVPLLKALRSANFMPFLNNQKRQGMYS
jgi:hypothetical protein